MNRKLALLAAATLAFPLVPSAFAESNMPCVVQGGTDHRFEPCRSHSCRSGGTGRRAGLKILL